MKRYLPIIVFAAFMATGYGCKKKSQSGTAQIKSGTYVWMGSTYSSDVGGSDVFTEFPITVISDTSVQVGKGGKVLSLTSGPKSSQLVFGEPGGYSKWETLYYDPANGTFKYSYAYFSSSGQGTQTDISTADYRRNIELRPFVNNIQGVKNMSGTRVDSVREWSTGKWLGSVSNINPAITFTSLSDSTISYMGVLDSGVLYYKKVDAASKTVEWQTHHSSTFWSKVTYNYSTSKFVFEQLANSQSEKHSVQLQ